MAHMRTHSAETLLPRWTEVTTSGASTNSSLIPFNSLLPSSLQQQPLYIRTRGSKSRQPSLSSHLFIPTSMRFLSTALSDSGRMGRVFSAVLCLTAVATTAAAFVLPESSRRDASTPTTPVVANGGWLNLTVIHTNDVHSRVDPANEFGVSCTDQDRQTDRCYGGTARHKTVIERLRKANQHSLLLDGGDEVINTLYFMVVLLS